MAILRIAVPVLKKVRSISRTGRCDMLRVMWLPTIELFDDVPNISAYFLYRECSSSFAAAMLGKNAIIDDCIFETPACRSKLSGRPAVTSVSVN